MDNSIRKIIREEVYKVMQEIGQEDPVALASSMVTSNEEQVKQLEDELRYRQGDMRVQGLPKEEKKAREERVKTIKQRLDLAKQELEMAKESQISAVRMQQMQTQSPEDSSSQVLSPLQSQI